MYYILWVLLAYIILYMIHVIRGPSVWDKLLALSLISTKTVLIIAAFAAIQDNSLLLDFALIYALFGFVGTVFTALFLSDFKRKH